jgi:phosphoglycerate kinase
MSFRTVRDLDASGKRVFVRVDFNVPLKDGVVTDDARIRAALPTIQLLIQRGARVILASHLGRPKGAVVEKLRMAPVAARLGELLGRPIATTDDCVGLAVAAAVARLGEGDVLLLENLRFHPEEEANDPSFAAALASDADAYVNDAFGTAHRAHASTVGVAKLLPAYAGLLMQRELAALSSLLDAPQRPFVAILGGAKVSDKLRVIDHLLTKVDTLVLGGGMANTFLLAQGHPIGASLAEPDLTPNALRILLTAREAGVRIVLPSDVVVATAVTAEAERRVAALDQVRPEESIVDIGPLTASAIACVVGDAGTVFWNGPLGVFEIPSSAAGTDGLAQILAYWAVRGTTVVVGGGDSRAAVARLGLTDRMTHVSTGGGASLEFVEGRELPGVAVLRVQGAGGRGLNPRNRAGEEVTDDVIDRPASRVWHQVKAAHGDRAPVRGAHMLG